MTTKNNYRLVQRQRTDADRSPFVLDKAALERSGFTPHDMTGICSSLGSNIEDQEPTCSLCHKPAADYPLAAFNESTDGLLIMALCVDCLRGIIRMLETAKEDRNSKTPS